MKLKVHCCSLTHFMRLLYYFFLNCIIEAIPVTEGHKYFPRGPRIG